MKTNQIFGINKSTKWMEGFFEKKKKMKMIKK